MKRFLVAWSLCFVGLRLVMLQHFFGVGVVPALCGLSELLVVAATLAALVKGRVGGGVMSAAVPVCYLGPLLFDVRLFTGFRVFAAGYCLYLVALWCTRLWMRECLTCGAPVFVRVISSGPFAVIRHPLSLLEFLGVCLLLGCYPSWWNCAVLALCLVAAVSHVLIEERFMLRVGGDYGRYCQTVGWRWFPGVW